MHTTQRNVLEYKFSQCILNSILRFHFNMCTSFQKIEREGANVINQGLDVLDQPGKYASGKWEEFKQYAGDRFGWHPEKDDDRPRSSSNKSTTGPGSAKTMGQGNIEGLKGGGSLASSNRARIRQNKRKLRIAKA